MVLLGLLLLIVSGAAVGLLALYNDAGGPTYSVVLFERELVAATAWQVFAAGAVLTLLAVLGMWMIAAGTRHQWALRSEVRAARREASAAERDRETVTADREPVRDGSAERVPAQSEPDPREPAHRRTVDGEAADRDVTAREPTRRRFALPLRNR